jgi:competence protein ComEA
VQTDNYFGRIDINKANDEELLRVNGLTLKLAEKIIEYRKANGRFKSINELKDIKGIGDYRFQKLKDLFFVE